MNHSDRFPLIGRRLTIALACLAAVLISLPAVAPAAAVSAADDVAPTAKATSLTVDEIISRHIEARGGLDRIRSIRSLRERGRITAGEQRQAVVSRERKRPFFTRFEITVQGVTGVIVSDGSHGWRMLPLEGDLEPKPVPEQAVTEAAEQADIEGPLVDWKAKGHRVELAGREAIDGHETYKLKLTLKSGAVVYEYIDVETFARVRLDSTRLVRGREVQIETTFGDQRMTGGVLFPHLIEIAAVGRPMPTRIVVDSIDVNPPLSDERFTLPHDGE